MKNRKVKIVLPVLALMLAAALLAGCGERGGESAAGNMSLESIVEKLYSNVEVPPYETVRLDKSNFEAFAFIPYDDSLSAVAADALVNITAHSVVVIRTEEGSGAELAAQIVDAADPNKWLCVGAELVQVAYTDHYVVLIMSDKVTADAVTENFRALAPEIDNMDMSLLTAGNSRYEQ